MSGSFDDAGRLDIADGRIIFAVGKKKSGKSVLARILFDSYPGDRIVLDVAGDDGPMGPGILDLAGHVDTLPRHWPEHRRPSRLRGEKWAPMTLRYVPDMRSPSMAADMDHVVGLAMAHGRTEASHGRVGCCLLIHEIGRVAVVNRVQPHMMAALMHNRHHNLTLIACGPRPKRIDTLVLSQADLIYIFEVPNAQDREKIAGEIGWNTGELAGEIDQLGPHEYLRFDSNEIKPEPGAEDYRLLSFPRLPDDVVRPYVTGDRRGRPQPGSDGPGSGRAGLPSPDPSPSTASTPGSAPR